MSPTHASLATEADLELYAQGSCHAFAIAMHRRLGTAFVVVTDPESPYWEDPADADNVIHSVTHVYALDADGCAWDVRGSRPLDAIVAEIREMYPDVQGADTDVFSTEPGLATYVDAFPGYDGEVDQDVDRPLHAVSETDIDEAWACAERVLAGMPGFDPAAAPTP